LCVNSLDSSIIFDISNTIARKQSQQKPSLN
jgi:hypothetical protein